MMLININNKEHIHIFHNIALVAIGFKFKWTQNIIHGIELFVKFVT